MVDNSKICFIICATDSRAVEECVLYLNQLTVPAGYSLDLLIVEDEKSVAKGYNEAMQACNAKYKVYLSQNTLIVNKDFLQEMLDVFQQNEEIGMLGCAGTKRLDKDGVLRHGKKTRLSYAATELVGTDWAYGACEELPKGYYEVEAIDGMLMATRYDVPWREDIVDGWAYYDVSQSLEFRRAGWKVAVLAQEENWVNHLEGCRAAEDEAVRARILQEYKEVFSAGKELRILFVQSKGIQMLGLAHALERMGHQVVIPELQVYLAGAVPEEVAYIKDCLDGGHYDMAVTYDFSPTVSTACDAMNVPYLAWIFDSPLAELYLLEAKNSCNYISVFDRVQYERLAGEKRIPHLLYLPLATETDIFGNIVIEEGDEARFGGDVAFVGRLYNKEDWNALLEGATPAIREEAETLVHSSACRWDGQNRIFHKASDGLIERIASNMPQEIWGSYEWDKRYICESLKIARRCNELERVAILQRLSEKYQVVHYSGDAKSAELPKVEARPWVDYWQEMPKVFGLSKINLNITSRSIESGIPQRVWDIMAAGGFCLTNYQPEIEEYFEIGQEIEVFHDLEELEQKVEYYLTHEEERVRIARKGFEKVQKEHDYINRLNDALQLMKR